MTSSWRRRLAELTAVAVAYYVVGRLGLLLAIPPGYATAVWPASGIALAGTLLFGYRVWPGILLGSFLINLRTSLDTTSTASILNTTLLAASIGMGASLQAMFGALLIRRFVNYPSAFLDDGHNIVKFLVLGGPVSCLVNATWGVTSLFWGGFIQPADLLFQWWTWWVGDAIGVVTFAPIILIWAVKPAVVSRGRQISVSVPLSLAFILVVIFFLMTNAWEKDRVKLEFERRTDQIARRLQENFENYIDVLHSVENIYASAVPITRQQFKTFVSRWFSRHPGIRAIAWNPRVLDAERMAYEQAARRDGLSNFQITEQNPQGEPVRATRRAEYVPAYYLESLRGTGRALGFDTASDPTRLEALNRARDTGKPTATDRLALISNDEREPGFVVFIPVYQPGRPLNSLKERRLNLEGYVSGAFRIGEILKTSLSSADTIDLDIRVYDARQTSPYDDQSPAVKSEGDRVKLEQVNRAALKRTIPFAFAERRWIMAFTPTRAYLIAQRRWEAWGVLAGGLFFSGLLGAFLLTLTGHTAKLQAINTDLEKEIIERERAEDAVTQLAAIVESSDDAIVGTTLEGVITSWNKGAELVYGYSAEEVKGRPVAMLAPPDRVDEQDRLRERIKEGEHVAQYETTRLTKGGAQVHVSLTLSPMKDATGKITAIATIARDITEQKRAASELQQLQQAAASRERMRLARELHDGVVQSLAAAGLRLQAAVQLLKVDPEETEKQLQQVQDLIVQEQRDLRSFINELNIANLVPPGMDFKLGYLLDQLVKTVERQ
jgi:PAS domain S-box-containing protein